jgi:hypothetical protein
LSWGCGGGREAHEKPAAALDRVAHEARNHAYASIRCGDDICQAARKCVPCRDQLLCVDRTIPESEVCVDAGGQTLPFAAHCDGPEDCDVQQRCVPWPIVDGKAYGTACQDVDPCTYNCSCQDAFNQICQDWLCQDDNDCPPCRPHCRAGQISAGFAHKTCSAS